jgi:hypothetical protein
MTQAARLADCNERFRRFRKIVIEHPRLGAIRDRIKWIMDQTESVLAETEERRLAAKGRPIKVEELWLLPLIGPSGAMKSTSIEKIVDEIYADPKHPDDNIPVMVISMRDVKNTRDFVSQILEAYGDAGADDVLSSKTMNARKVALAIYHIARKRGTLILIIDEAHEMLRHDGGKVGRQMASLLKTMVNECVFSIVLLGTEDLVPLFKSHELLNRSLPDADVHLGAFDIEKQAEREYFFSFLQLLEDTLKEDGVVSRSLGWVESIEDCAKMFDMSGGILGTACRMLFMALERAFRAGRSYLEWKDIETAFRAFNRLRPESERTFDPFPNGPKKKTIAILKVAI